MYATIQSNGNGRFYISYGATRSRQDYATPQNAAKAARRKGYSITGDLPDPDAVSIAQRCTYSGHEGGDMLRLELDDGVVEFRGNRTLAEFVGAVELANRWFRKMGYKPVRVTYSMMDPTRTPRVIDEDTPNYLDVASESYWSA